MRLSETQFEISATFLLTTGEKCTELSAPCHKNCCIRRKRTHTISVVFQSRWLYDNPRVAIRSHTVQAFRRHLGLPDTRGLDLIVVSELASVWIPWVLSNKTSHNKLELWAQPLYDVRRFHCTMDFDTQRERHLLIHDYASLNHFRPFAFQFSSFSYPSRWLEWWFVL